MMMQNLPLIIIIVVVCLVAVLHIWMTRDLDKYDNAVKSLVEHYSNKPRMKFIDADKQLPPEAGNYLTCITITKTILRGSSDSKRIVVDTAKETRWEVLGFNPEFKSAPKWNTLHLNDWEVKINWWAELPPPITE